MDLAGMKRRELQALCKRHGLPAGGTNVALVARLDAALSGAAAGAEEEGVAGVVAAAKGCLKQPGEDAAEAKKVRFAAEEGRARRLRTRAVWSPVVHKAKTRGKSASAEASTDSAAAVAAAEDGVSAEVGANVPVRRSRRKSVVAVEAEEVGEAVAVDRKRKRKNQDNDDGAVAVTVSAQVGASSRVTRRSSLAGVALVLPPAVEKKRGRGKIAGGSSKLAAEAQDSESDVRNSAQVEASARITRARRSMAPVVVSPDVVENKRRRKTGDARASVELPTVSDVPRNEAPVTRSLRSRVVEVDNSMVAETNTARQLESKKQHSRPTTRRHQQVSSSVEDKKQEQVAAPNKAPVLRRSGRNCSEDAEKQTAVKEPVKRSTRKSVALATLEKGENVLIEEKNPGAHVRRSMRKSVVPVKDIKGIGEKIHNANGEDAVKQPVRGSRRKSVVPELHEKEKGLIAEKNMEAHEGKSKRKPVMPVKDTKAVGEVIQNAKGKDVEKHFVVKQPTRRSSRKSVLPDMPEINSGLLAAEMNAEMNVRRSTRKSVEDIPNEKGNIAGSSSKRRRTTASEEMRSVKEANDDIIIREAAKVAHKATQESGQVNVTREEHSLGPLLVTQTLPNKISTAQSVPVVIPGSESGDNANESSDKSKQEHSNFQAVDSHLSEKSAELDQSFCITGLVLRNFDVSEDKSLMSKDGLSIGLTVGDREEQSPVSGEGRLGLEANAREPGEKNLANVKSTVLNAKILQHDTGIIAKETDKDVLSLAFPIEEHGEKYTGSPVAVEKVVGWEASECLQHDCDVLTKETGEAFGAAPPISEDTNPEIQCNAGESIQAADLGKCPSQGSIGNLYLEGAADDCILPVLNADKGCSSDGRPSSYGLDLMFAEACKESFSKITENIAVEIVDGNKHSTPVRPGFYVESVHLEDEDVQPSGCDADADKNLNVDQGIAGEEVLAQEKSSDQHVPTKTEQNMKLNDEVAGSGMESGLQKANLDEERVLSDFSLDAKHIEVINSEEVASEGEGSKKLVHSEDLKALFEETDFNGPDNLDQQVIIQVQQGDVQECDLEKPSLCSSSRESKHESGFPEEYTSVEIDGGNKPRAPLTPGFSVVSDCLEYEDVLPTGCDADKKLDVDQSVVGEDINDVTPGLYLRSDCLEDDDGQPTRCDADKKLDVDKAVIEEEVLAQEKSNDQHAPAKTDLNMKINDELAGSVTESGCSITEKNTRLVVDNLDEQAIILVQLGDVEEATPLPVEIGGGNKPTLMEDEDVQPTAFDADMKLDFDQGITEEEVLAQQKRNDQHVPTKTDLNMKLNDELASPCTESGCSITEKNTRPFADNIDRQAIFQVQPGDVQEGDLKKPSPCSTTPECKHKYGLPQETVLLPKNTGSLSSVEQSPPFGLESLFSQENIDESMGSATAHTKNGSVGSKDCLVKSALENTHVSKPYSLNDIVEGISKNDDCMQTSQHDNGMEDAIKDPSICLEPTGYKHEDALSEEAAHTLKNYAGTCSSNPRELLMDLQSLFSKGNIKESHPDDGLAFPSAENSGDESISVEQCVKVYHSSNLSHIGSTDLLDELIGCSNTEVLHQSHSHEDGSNMDRVEQVASEPCTNYIVEASASAECIESGLVLLPTEQRSNLSDGQLNPKLESPTNMGSGLNCDKYVCNTMANGSAVVVVGERTPSSSGLPEDYPKDHYPREEPLDSCLVESSVQGTICRRKIVSAVSGIGSPSSLATHDYKYEGALSKESVCRMENYIGMISVDPKHLIMEMQSPHSEGSTEKPDLQDNLAFKYEGVLSKEAVCRMKNYTGMSSVDPKHLIMEMQSPHSEGSPEKPDLQDNLAFPCALNGRDEPVVCHVEELLAPHISSEPDAYQCPSEDLDLTDDANLIERDIVAPVEVSCEEKHIVEANSRLSSCGTGTEVLHQEYKEECNKPNEGKVNPKALVENNMSEDAPIEGIMLPLVAGSSEISDEQPNTKMSDESEELCFSSDKDTIDNFCTGSAKGDLYSLPEDFHIDTCQKQDVPEVLSLPESAEESAKFHCVSVSGSGPCQQRVNESTSMQATYDVDETVNLDHEYNQNYEDQTTPGIPASSVPEAVEIEIEQSEMEIGLIPATETSVLPVPDEQPNSKLEGNEDQTTPGIPASIVPEAVEIEIEQSEMEIGLIPATETSVLPVPDEQPNNKLEGNEDKIIPGILASSVPEAVVIEQSQMEMGLFPIEETSVLPVPDEQLNSKLEGNEVDGHSCSYGKDFFILSDSESLKRETSSLNKDGCMDLSSEDDPNDLPAPRSPEPSAYIQNDNESGSVGFSQSSRRSGISELRAKLQSFKVSSTVKGSYIAMSALCPKPGDSMSQSAAALLRNIENTPAVKAGHPVKPNADGKDSSRRALQPISGRPREH